MATITTPEVDPSIIHSDPDIMGGEPVFTGTRVPVRRLQEDIKYGRSLGAFLYDYPTVDREQLIKAVDLLFARTIGPKDDEESPA